MSLSHCYLFRSLTTRCHLLTPASRTPSSAQSVCPAPSGSLLVLFISSWRADFEKALFCGGCCSLFWGTQKYLCSFSVFQRLALLRSFEALSKYPASYNNQRPKGKFCFSVAFCSQVCRILILAFSVSSASLCFFSFSP